MTRKMLYKSAREGGGFTVSLQKPDVPYQVRWRLIADEGRAITDGETTATVIDVLHRSDCDAWTDCDLPDELQPISIEERMRDDS